MRAETRSRSGSNCRHDSCPGSLNALVAYIAHELRTPLATQRALLELSLADRDTNAATWVTLL
jgi:nitrogen-specific signal transduction histidine kinase